MRYNLQGLKNTYHFFQAHFWRLVYGMPDRGLKIYGITGTNGKTTTCYLLTGILAKAYGPKKVGMLTTVAFRIGEEETWNETKLTTLPSRLVYSYLSKMRQSGVKYVVIEMTSHALDQNRLAGIHLDGAIILNISPEHLNYHKTVEALAAAKAKIIRYLKPHVPLVANQDDRLVRSVAFATNITWFTRAEAQSVQLKLEGDVNKENALAAGTLAKACGVSQADVTAGIFSVEHVPGRMEWIDGPGFRVVIDYAVTPDAIERLYTYVRHVAKGRVIGVLGGTGLRDRDKRPKMASIAAAHADMLILTREDPWTENEEQIFRDLEKGLDPNAEGKRWKRIVDRKAALTFALGEARDGDIVVATGKGAETGMAIGKRIVPYNERKVIERIIGELS